MKTDIKEIIQSDLYRYGGLNSIYQLSFMQKKELYGYRYTKIMRLCKYHKSCNNKIRFILYRLLLEYYSSKFGFQIPYSTDIGKGLYLGHLGTIVINYKTKIGSNVNIAQGVTIGISNRGVNKGVPVIGNNVWIGANSVIVGGIHVGNDVMIAPNTFVNFDVPDHSVVISQRSKIIQRENATKEYINYEVKS